MPHQSCHDSDIYVNQSETENLVSVLMVRSHCPTPRQTQRPRQTQMLIKRHKTQWKPVLVSVSVQYEHLHIILYNPFLSISLSVSASGNMNTPLSASAQFTSFTNIQNRVFPFEMYESMTNLSLFTKEKLHHYLLIYPARILNVLN